MKVLLPVLLLLLGLNTGFTQTHCKMDVIAFVIPDFCDPSMVILHAQPSGPQVLPITYAWSNGGTTKDITVPFTASTYTVTATDNVGCTAVDEVTIDDPANFEYFIEAYNLCPGESAQLAVSWGYYEPPFALSYQWSTGANTPYIDIPGPGSYSVTLTDGLTGCSQVITKEVILLPASVPVLTGPATLCSGQTGTLTVTGVPFGYYYWDPPIGTGETEIITEPGIYSVTVVNTFSCVGTATIEVLPGGQTPDMSGPVEICAGSNATLSVQNAALFNSFLWSNGAATSSITVNSGDTYFVTVTQAGGCTAVGSVDVTEVSLDLTGVASPNTSCSTPNGMVDISISPGGAYSFNWTGGSAEEDLTDVTAGTYTVTVSNGGTCSATASFVVGQNITQPTVTSTSTPASCGQNNGAVNITVSPASGNTFIWSNSEVSEDISNVVSGTYTVTVTDINGCSATHTRTVLNSGATININGVTSPNTSCGAFNGTVNVTVAPAGAYFYTWTGGETTEDLSNVPSGTYFLTVTDGSGCSATASFVVGQNITLPTVTSTTTPASCGQNNGAVNISVSPATGNTFLWSNSEVTEDLANVLPGTYTVTVTDNNGCSATHIRTVLNSGSSITINGVTAPNTSCGAPNGSVNITVTPAAAYTFIWSGGEVTANLSNVAAGTYSLTVTDGSGCSATASFVVGQNTSLTTVTSTTTPASCGQNTGAVNISVSPATGNTFVWSNSAVSEDITNIAPGNYTVTVTDANGCSATHTAVVLNNGITFNIAGVSTPNTACLPPNGSVDITVSPVGTYTFNWTGGDTTEDLGNLSAGTYTVTVSDASNCSATASFIVGQNTSLTTVTSTTTPASCGQNTGAVNISVSPATGNTFVWSNSAVSEDITNIAPGNYTVTVTDANGCSATHTAVVLNNGITFNIAGVSTPNTACLTPNGSVDITVSPVGMYTFQWTGGTTTEDLGNLSAGTYTVTVSDASNCSATASFVVGQNTTLPTVTSTSTPASCGQNTGAVNISVSPATGNTFVWSNSAVSEDITNVGPGNYTVTVTDANGCSATHTAVVLNNGITFNIAGATAPNTACLTPNGAVNITVSPVGTYTFNWTGGTTTEDLGNLSAGTYTVTVSDASNCSATASFVVGQNTTLPTVTSTTTPANCGQNTGAVNITVSPATGNTFVWSNSAVSEDISNVAPGNYTVTVTDANGCSATHTAVVLNNGITFNIAGVTTPNTACLTPNGAVNITVSPVGTYTFNWTGGDTAEDLGNLSAGTYTVTVSDASNCSATASFIVGQNTTLPNITSTTTPANCGQNTGAVNISVSPATGNTFVWSNSAVSEDITNVAPGNYTVTVTDANGCSATHTAVVLNNGITFNIAGVTTPNTACLTPNGAVDITVSPVGTYTFNWTGGTTTENLGNLSAGTYTVTVSDASNCSATASFVVGQNTTLPNITSTITPASCGQNTGAVNITVSPASGNTFVWSNSAVSEDISNVAPGNYTVTVTDANGCSATATQQITATLPPTVEIAGLSQICEGSSTSLSATAGFVQYQWSTGQTVSPLTVSQAGTYGLTVTDINGCTGTDTWTIGTVQKIYTYLEQTTCSAQDTGTIQQTFTSLAGCDSVVITHTGLKPPVSTTLQLWVCMGGTATYNGVSMAAGSQQNFLFTTKSGCDSIVSLTVSAYPAVTLYATASRSCANMANGTVEITTSTGTPPLQFTLNNGTPQQDHQFAGLSPGQYMVALTDANGCTAMQAIVVTATQPVDIQMNNDTLDCDHHTVMLQPELISGNTTNIEWTWSTGTTTPWLEVGQSGTYTVTVNDGCTLLSRSIEVVRTVDVPESFFYVPNCFTPAGEGVNSRFRAFPDERYEVRSFLIRVFDRWGNKMFESRDINDTWDGDFNQKNMQPGVYVWYMEAEVVLCDGSLSKVFKKGDVTIIR